jgi:hypothetical protein
MVVIALAKATPFLTSFGFLLFCVLLINKQQNYLKDHPINLPTKYGFNWPIGFTEQE